MATKHTNIFGTYRNDWYNFDFLELMSKRLRLENVKTVLDVGCGHFQWSQVICQVCPNIDSVTGIDINDVPEELLSEHVQKNESTQTTFRFIKGSAYSLPFEDNTFDMVTAQTLFIHLESPENAIQEMKRVLKPEGVFLSSEPNNLSQTAFTDSVSVSLSDDERIALFTEKYLQERDKEKRGMGNNSIGEIMAQYLSQCGLVEIDCVLNDKVIKLVPPYNGESQRAKIDMLSTLVEDYPFDFSDAEQKILMLVSEAIRSREYLSYSPTMLFLTSGFKRTKSKQS